MPRSQQRHKNIRLSGRLRVAQEACPHLDLDTNGEHMSKVKRWLYIAILLGLWELIYNRVSHAAITLEPKLLSKGQAGRWWMIVGAYWILDTLVILAILHVFRKPFGLRLPVNFPFFQFAIDAAVLVLLVHVAWLCSDHYVFLALLSIGLGSLWEVFLVLASLWLVVAFVRYKAISKLVADCPK